MWRYALAKKSEHAVAAILPSTVPLALQRSTSSGAGLDFDLAGKILLVRGSTAYGTMTMTCTHAVNPL